MKFLVIPQINRIGDIICATPVFRAIKEKYPESRLVVLVSKTKGAWEIIKNNPRIDGFIFYEDWYLISKIRREKFDWAFNITNYPVPSPIAFLGLIPNRVKTVVSERSLSEILTDRLNNYRVMFQYHTDVPMHNVKLLELVGIKNASVVKEVFTIAATDQKTEKFLSDAGFSRSDFIAGISVTAGNRVKEWPPEKFALVADGIIQKYRAKVIFIGSAKDAQVIEETAVRMKMRKHSFSATGFTVEELPSLMKRLNLFVSADTGPVHIAEALKIPLVDIMGPVDPREIAPRGPNSVVVTPPPEIPPSIFIMKKAGPEKEQRRAIEAISVEMVLAGVEKAMKYVIKARP